MKIFHCCAILAIFSFCSASAQSSVWRVSNGDQVLYLGGTCHILRKSDFPLPLEFEQTYVLADSLTFEVDPKKLQDPSFAMRMMSAGVYQDGRTLKSVLSEEAYEALAAQCRESNIPIEVIHKTKPGLAVMMLALQELAKAGVTEQGVDVHFANRAHAEGKAVTSLETAEFQLDLITNLGEGIESEMVLYGLQDLDQVSELIDEMILAWRSGDLDKLDRLFVEDMKAFPEIYELILKNRNVRWIPQIEAMLATQPTEFVLVGVGHMPGENGLIALLKAKGFSVEQVAAK